MMEYNIVAVRVGRSSFCVRLSRKGLSRSDCK